MAVTRETVIKCALGLDQPDRARDEPRVLHADRVVEAFKTAPKFEIIASNLSHEQEAKLKAAQVERERLAEAVEVAARRSMPGDVVLLSPGCTSFDEFQDFAERGDKFKEWVRSL